MNELPTDPRAQGLAILRLEAQVQALRFMVALLIADNGTVLKGVRHYAGMVEDISLASMATDDQITTMREEFESVLESIDKFHKAAGIDPDRAEPNVSD
jgi:hypothetical protein